MSGLPSLESVIARRVPSGLTLRLRRFTSSFSRTVFVNALFSHQYFAGSRRSARHSATPSPWSER